MMIFTCTYDIDIIFLIISSIVAIDLFAAGMFGFQLIKIEHHFSKILQRVLPIKFQL